MTFAELRDRHKSITYEGFEIKKNEPGVPSYGNGKIEIVFHFFLDPEMHLYTKIVLPDAEKYISEPVFKNLIFNLGMVELLSYWKSACPQNIIIKAGYLNEDQIKFWKNLLIKGLGEFFYQNKINFTQDGLVDFAVIPSYEVIQLESLHSELDPRPLRREASLRGDDNLKDRNLILIGGGKDSAVTMDLIKKTDRKSNCLLLNPTDYATTITQACSYTSPIIVHRELDPKLLELNKQGYLNGHTPFSAYLAFLSVLMGVLFNYKNLMVSNEESSNEGNINWLGHEINHQYSKSFEFEQKFREYNQKYLSNTNYFSFLRPLNELQISELFAEMPEYHPLFRSCNVGSKTGIWCGECPKCVSTYLLLFPFLGERTNGIFNKNLFDDERIIPVIKGLIRTNDQVKPFECVATVDEIKYGIFLSVEKYSQMQKPLPVVLEKVKDYAIEKPELLIAWNEENNLNEESKVLLMSFLRMQESN